MALNSAQIGGGSASAYGPSLRVCITAAASIGTAEATASSTWVAVTMPGAKFRLTSSALRPRVVPAG